MAADPFALSVHVIFQSPPVTIRVLKYIAQIKDSQNDVIMDQVELPQVSLKNRWPHKGGSAVPWELKLSDLRAIPFSVNVT